MTDKNITIGHVINVTGMIGVSSGVLLFTFGIVLLLFRHGFGFDIPSSFHWFWQLDPQTSS
jgi:nitrate reductase gamma subunit